MRATLRPAILGLPRFSVVRQVLQQGLLGKIVEVYANLGEYLVNHHGAMDAAQGVVR